MIKLNNHKKNCNAYSGYALVSTVSTHTIQWQHNREELNPIDLVRYGEIQAPHGLFYNEVVVAVQVAHLVL